MELKIHRTAGGRYATISMFHPASAYNSACNWLAVAC